MSASLTGGRLSVFGLADFRIALYTVIPALYTVIPAPYTAIPSKAGIHRFADARSSVCERDMSTRPKIL